MNYLKLISAVRLFQSYTHHLYSSQINYMIIFQTKNVPSFL